MGTARMGHDARSSVLNKYNQVHEVPNVFVTDGSAMTSAGNVNPSLTYMALTARAADHAVKELKKMNIYNIMDRRRALKNLGTGIGAFTLSTSMINLLQSCQNQTNLNLLTFSSKQFSFISKLMDLIIPSTDLGPQI